MLYIHVAKSIRSQITAHRPWHLAKKCLSLLLSAKVLNNLEKTITTAENSYNNGALLNLF